MASTPAPSPASTPAAARRWVVCPARNSSHRPADSSPRRALVAASSPQTDATSAVTPIARQSVKPPSVVIWWVSPSSALSPALLAIVPSSRSRWAAVGAIV
jgi:hypothetical protein